MAYKLKICYTFFANSYIRVNKKYVGHKFFYKGDENLPRIARKYSEIKVYHTTIRGNDKQNIFFDEQDRYKFMDIIKETKEKYNYDIYSYCLMDNHVHLVIYDKEYKLSKIMQSIQISYAIYFNIKYDRVGHLFQDRFFSSKVEDREYLKIVCRYIHQNPQKAGIAKTEEYKWSSYKEYIGKPKIINNKLLLSIFSEDFETAKEEFIKFHNINSDSNKEEEIKNIIEFELCEKMSDEEIEKHICELLGIQNISEILKYNRVIQKEKLSRLKCFSNISISQLSRIIRINRKMLERIIKG